MIKTCRDGEDFFGCAHAVYNRMKIIRATRVCWLEFIFSPFKNLFGGEMAAMQEFTLWQTPELPVATAWAARQNPMTSTHRRPPRSGTGAEQRKWSARPNRRAKCSGPVSPEIKTSARFKTARTGTDQARPRMTSASGVNFFNSFINVCSRAPGGGCESKSPARPRSQLIKGRPNAAPAILSSAGSKPCDKLSCPSAAAFPLTPPKTGRLGFQLRVTTARCPSRKEYEARRADSCCSLFFQHDALVVAKPAAKKSAALYQLSR